MDTYRRAENSHGGGSWAGENATARSSSERRAEELGINARQLRRWRDAVKRDGQDAFPGQGKSRDEEITRLKRRLAKVEQERDFLREAAAYFAKESK
jgi:transposase